MNECLYAGGNEDSVSTSSPMILRSACSHRRTPERSCHDCSRMSNSNGTNIYSSDSSIEKQKHKSSNLKIKLRDSHSQRNLSKSKISEETELSKSEVEKSSCSTLGGFSIFSSSSDSAFANFLNLKLFSSKSSNAEYTCRELVPSEKVKGMSRTSYTRSSISSTRDIIPDSLEYEYESRSSYSKRARSLTSSSYANSSTSAQFESKVGSQLNNSLSQHNSPGSLTTFKENMLEFIRWLLWKCIYIQILKVQHFEIWLLSRISSIGKFKTCVAIIALPLLIWLIFSVVPQETNGWIVSSISTLNRGFSYLKPSSEARYTSEEDEHVQPGSCMRSSTPQFLTSLFMIPSYIVSFFTNYENKVVSKSAPSTQPTETVYKVTKDEIKLLVSEAWEEKASDIMKTMNRDTLESNVDIAKKSNNQEGRIKAEISKLHTEFKSLADDMKLLQKNMLESLQRTDAFSASSTKQNEMLQLFDRKIIQMEKKIEDLDYLILLLKDCCSKQFNATDFYTAFETHLTSALRNISTADSSTTSSYSFFRDWLDSKFITDKYLKSNIESAIETLNKDSKSINDQNTKNVKSIIESVVKQHIGSIKAQMLNDGIKLSGQTNLNAFSLSDVKRAIKDAIMLYDADKNGLVDYALESGGGSVLGTRCSETFSEKNARFSILGLPLWYSSNSPRTAIQPAVHPGDCWAFKGTQGFLVIQLSAAVRLKGFSLEHIPVFLSPTGNIDSAPKEFSVWGLVSEKDSVGNLLGKYVYDYSGEPLQYFEVQEFYDEFFSFVELKIHSNHGNPEYTCLYRFRVHGSRT